MAAQLLGCTPESVRRQLQRILDTQDFDASERNRRFLEYVVEEALADRADRIKAYSIATTVFGRDDSFDPQMDPIVRIEASRLRRSLERYYLTCGSNDPIKITIPKGGYVPDFEVQDSSSEAGATETEAPNDATEAPSQALPSSSHEPRLRRFGLAALGLLALVAVGLAASWLGGFQPFAKTHDEAARNREGPSIFVMPFVEDGDPLAFPNFTRGFTRELIVGLTYFKDLFVFGPETSFRYGGETDLQQVVADLDVDFVLAGGTTVYGDRFAVDAQLINIETGQYVWATRAEGPFDPEDILAVRDDLATQVARSLAQPYGVIFTNQAKASEGKPPDSLTSYDCVIRFYLYWKSYRRTMYRSVRSCLEDAIAADDNYADAFAALSFIHSDAYRFGFDDGAIPGDPRQKALELAKRAIELEPNLTRGHHALSLAYWLNNDVGRSLEAGRKGLLANPNDAELMAELGMRYSWRNRWDEGLPLLHEAYTRNPAQPSGYRLALFLDHYINGRYEEALREAKKIDTPNLVYGHLVVAIASAQLGMTEEAMRAVDRILEISPTYGEIVVKDLEKRNIHPLLISSIVDGLRKAGLAIPENDASKTGS